MELLRPVLHNPNLVVRGARQHNLQNVSVEVPRERLVVFTGLSGSGKSSLAFDTIFAEGQRRYIESLSSYARQFLGMMEKPDVDGIDGLSPSISIEQKSISRNPRSTVGTVTEIYDYLRLLYARAGTPFCPECDNPIERQPASRVVEHILSRIREGTPIQVLAPLVRGRKGEFREVFREAGRSGFARALVNGRVHDLREPPKLARYENHDIAIIVDRLLARESDRSRLADSVETALRTTQGLVEVLEGRGKDPTRHLFSEDHACAECGASFPELEPRGFSFNSPHGACPDCGGLGTSKVVDEDLIVPDRRLSIREGAVKPWGEPGGLVERSYLPGLAKAYGINPATPWHRLSERQRDVILYGSKGRVLEFPYSSGKMKGVYRRVWEGVIGRIARRHRETDSPRVREILERFMAELPCRGCGGSRLNPFARAVRVAGKAIHEVVDQPIKRALEFFEGLELDRDSRTRAIAEPVLKEIRDRLGFLSDVGLGYLHLSRSAATLSGGESQRIRLATQIGSRLVGVLYVLDEPSIGLHQRDNHRLLATLGSLRDQGNTVLVVEHDEDTILAADYVVDIGPGAGRQGGRIVAQGSPEDVRKASGSITGEYLSGAREIPTPATRRPASPNRRVTVRGAREHNLREIDVHFPLGLFVAVTGVSGSGKSTLVNQTLYRALAQRLQRSHRPSGAHDAIEGLERLDKVIEVNQAPIGRTPRSNPATYTGLFAPIRKLFSELPESRARGYGPGRFSFNVKGGRCEECRGAGLVKIEMHFLPDVYVPCDVCNGKRYNRETLEIRYKGKTIADVLEMSVSEALEFFWNVPPARRKLETLEDVGLGYIELGQSATTLSGGEAQRVKLATELSKPSTGRTLYILDEPTTGLHFEDVRVLLDALHRLVDQGSTVVVIEHNLHVVKTADWVIDLGPEGGSGGGDIVACGTPEEVAGAPGSFTGAYLGPLLEGRAAGSKALHPLATAGANGQAPGRANGRASSAAR